MAGQEEGKAEMNESAPGKARAGPEKKDQNYKSVYLKCLGYFSVDKNRTFLPDSSLLKYFNPPTNKNICLDLNEGIESVVRRKESFEKDSLGLLLKWIELNYRRIRASPTSQRFLQPKFICTRGSLTRILTSPYLPVNEWTVYAAKWRGNIYLCSRDIKPKLFCTSDTPDQFSSWGFKFEQYVLSDSPDKAPDTSKPVLEPAAFRCVYQRYIGDHTVLFSAVMKGVCSKTTLKDPLPLANLKFVETKTTKIIQNAFHEITFYRYKVLKWWAQCYFTDTSQVLCGFRDESGIVQQLTKYDIEYMLEKARRYWKPMAGIQYCKSFFNTISETVVDDCNEAIYRFEKVANESVKFKRLPPEGQHAFLPQSYMDGFK